MYQLDYFLLLLLLNLPISSIKPESVTLFLYYNLCRYRTYIKINAIVIKQYDIINMIIIINCW